MHHFVLGICLFLGLGLLSSARAQTVSNQLEFGISGGRVIRHNAKFKPVVNGPSFLYQLSWIRHTNDSLAWRKAANFPRVGGGTDLWGGRPHRHPPPQRIGAGC